ncbi:MAG: DUF2721 domain-containing protein [Deltaproteobacteria bacterium]|nr:DUF2721 domain-containing protein [Deltaproteobacteria bacterium]
MPEIHGVDGVARAIQLAIAPVFLLSTIALFMNVLTSRLGRVIDRTRVLEEKPLHPASGTAAHHAELATLSRRAKLIDYAITLSTTTSLLVCGVIVTLFLGTFLNFNVNITVMVLFITAMLSLVLALLCLLREILIATLNLIH